MLKKHIYYYDLIKIFAAFLVCFYHSGLSNVGGVTNSFYIPNFDKLILNFCAMSVPLFFMVNGALMLRRKYSMNELICRALKIVFLYFIWVIFLGEFGNILFGIDRLSFVDILKGNRTWLSVHLWFLRTMAVLTLMIPILKKIYEQKSKLLLYLVLLGMFIFPFLYNYVVVIARWLDIKGLNNLSVTGVFTMYSIMYFLLGKIIADISAKQSGNCKKYTLLSVISIFVGWLMVSLEVTLWSNMLGTVYDGVNSSFPTIGALLMAVGVFYLFSTTDTIPMGNKKIVIDILSGNIMGIYILHPMTGALLSRYIHVNASSFNACIITVIIMLVSAVITHLIRKVPVLKKIITI